MPIGQAKFGLLGGVADPGKLELIETKNVSSSSSAIFTSIQESTYNVHFLTVNDFQPSDDTKFLGEQMELLVFHKPQEQIFC